MTTAEANRLAEALERIASLEQEVEQVTARAESYENDLAAIRRLVTEFTEGDMNPNRGMLFKIDRVAAGALS